MKLRSMFVAGALSFGGFGAPSLLAAAAESADAEVTAPSDEEIEEMKKKLKGAWEKIKVKEKDRVDFYLGKVLTPLGQNELAKKMFAERMAAYKITAIPELFAMTFTLRYMFQPEGEFTMFVDALRKMPGDMLLHLVTDGAALYVELSAADLDALGETFEALDDEEYESLPQGLQDMLTNAKKMWPNHLDTLKESMLGFIGSTMAVKHQLGKF